MSQARNRRDFMKMTAAGVAGVAVADAVPTAAKSLLQTKSPAGDIELRLTAGDKRFAPEPSLKWTPARGKSAAVVLDPARSYQEVLGFGGALTDAACYMLNQLDAPGREKLLHEFFDPAEMGFSACRVCIGSSDYATKAYNFDEGTDPDPELKRFSIEHDKEYILPTLRAARHINPELFLFGSPWSPPEWMKSNGSMKGGNMRKSCFAPYAQYFLKFLQGYAEEGVPVNAVSTQNEVDTDQDGKMPACLWGQEYEIEFVGKHLGPVLEQASLNTRIWLVDHNYDLWGRAICTLEKPDVFKYADGVAWHGYSGTPDGMTRVHNAFPNKHAYWTEGGPEYTAPDYQTDWTKWSSDFTAILRNWARCIIAWNLALDEKGRPNIGHFACGGVVTIDSRTKEIRRSGQYWAFAHYSRAIRRGARRIESRGEINGVSHVAFVNPDGTHALVLTNAGSEQRVTVQLAGMSTELALPSKAVATLTWK